MTGLPERPRDIAFMVWMEMLGRPYIWGGDDPAGVDCSGLVILGLQAAGVLPRKGDWSAGSLSTIRPGIPLSHPPQVGYLLFWNRGNPPAIGHVEIVLATPGVKVITIGASGGGSATTSAAVAYAQNAFVKVHEAEPGWVRMIDPFA